MKSILTEAGMTLGDLVFVQVICTDMSLYPKFNEVYKTYFVKDYPARRFVGSGSGPLGPVCTSRSTASPSSEEQISATGRD